MVDLHLHLDGSLDPDDMENMAKLSGITLPTHDNEQLRELMTVSPDCTNLGEYLEKFELPLMVLQTSQCLEYAVYKLLKTVSEEGLCYVEIRFAPQLHTRNSLTQEKAVYAAVKGLKKGIKDFGIAAQLILCCMRGDTNFSENMETVRVASQFLGRGVCAVDLAGNEAVYPTSSFETIFLEARKLNLPIIIHAGEADGSQSIRKALEFGAVRIGHGIRAAQDDELMKILARKKIILEICFSSNLQTRTVEDVSNYPIRLFIERGMKITVNTDNVTVSGTSLKKEYHLLKNQFGFSVETLKMLAQNGADGAFLPPDKKYEIKEQIERQFEEWIKL